MEFERAELELDGPVAILSMNHPEVMNAISPEMLAGMASALDALAKSNERIRCMVLTGTGRAFSTGANLQGRGDSIEKRGAGQALETLFHPFIRRLSVVVRAPISDRMTVSKLARLTIVLKDVEPAVLRVVEVPLSIWLDQLHLLLQAAMGWSNSHLYEFVAGNLSWGFVDPDSETSRLDAQKAQLRDLLSYSNVFTYLYDFGDGWEHTITVEGLADPAPDVLYPRLMKVEGPCPPEEGLSEFLCEAG